jgi:hypothetical protein
VVRLVICDLAHPIVKIPLRVVSRVDLTPHSATLGQGKGTSGPGVGGVRGHASGHYAITSDRSSLLLVI